MAAGFQILTVTQLCRYVKSLLEEQRVLADVMVKGEVVNLTYRQSSGHLYFSIRDEGGLIRCVMFSRYVQNLRDLPEDGSAVLVRGAATLYERDGAFQIVVYDIQSLGEGRGKQDLEALKKKLLKEGLFAPEGKRPLPKAPHTIGVITSREGAAFPDIVQAFRRRGYAGKLILYPCTVQGTEAAPSILRALRQLEKEGLCQAAVISRGGGPAGDLSAFNDEALAYGAYNCPVPLVSAVGHQIDVSILDLVADARAATPTAVAELLIPDREALRQQVKGLRELLQGRAAEQVRRKKLQLFQEMRLLSAKSPRERLEKNRQRLEFLVRLLIDAEKRKIQGTRGRVFHLLRQLELLNPAAVMCKGYSITMAEGKALTTVEGLVPGQELVTLLADGEIIYTVRSCGRNEENNGRKSDH